ncbi:MAG TPA: DNA translocase FtsK 4TM domain-containing protein [Solirubrobacteraceae bacterium]|nr:DNA translocase FtsK 4TM domain-containing protein [Solirubrobacteraceae bacterium]
MATTRRKPKSRAKATRTARRRAKRRPRSWRPPPLGDGGREVLSLALVLLGVFLGFVIYGGWHGGRVGQGLDEALGWLLGGARIFAPPAIALAGAVWLAAPATTVRHRVRAGVLCLFAGVTLMLAADTAGVSSTPSGEAWGTAYLRAHGGVVGQGLYALLERLVGTVGVTLLIVLALAAAALLVSGTSLAAALRAVRSAMRAIADWLRAPPEEPVSPAAETLEVPEPHPAELIVRQTHVEAPAHEPLAEAAEEEQDAPAETGAQDEDEATGESPAIAVDADQLTPQGRYRASVTDDPDFKWRLPSAQRILTRSSGDQSRPDTAGQERTAKALLQALGHFGIEAQLVGTISGPHITRYELRLAPGIKVGKVSQLKDDLAYALAATDVRILAPIPGKRAVGVEVPNTKRRMVRLGDVYQEPPADWSPLTVWLGKDVAGKAIGADLAKMPHLLVAGTTGAGKSGAINAMLASVLLRATPREVRLVLVDPKQVELNRYESLPHLLTPVITNPRMAANALQNLVREMEQRYGAMSLLRTRSLIEMNAAREARGEPPLPYILCVIDELADLMMVAPADVEDSIIRLAQKARAVGIHLVLATQSPRVDVITGMIKANVPSRIAFAVSSQTDSRVILDQNGAESLLGQGDMLFSPIGSSRLQRIQGAYIDESQIDALADQWRRQGEPELHEELLEQVESEERGGGDELDPDEDPMLADAIQLVVEMQTASTSMLQRRLRLGYTRAGRMIDMLERRGVISGYEGSKPRQVLISEADLPRILAQVADAQTAQATD